MPLPKRRHSKTRQRLRRIHIKLDTPNPGTCSHCGEAVANHTVCKACGYYRDRQVLKPKDT